MSSITLTAAMRANLLSLQGTASLLGQTQFRLATGNKVNSALDNASAFFASQSLNNKANDLSSLLDGMGQNVQVLKAADQGITGLTALVQQAKSIAETAAALPADITVPATAGVKGTVHGTVDFTGNEADVTALANVGDSMTITVGSWGPKTITIGASPETLQALVDDINSAGVLGGGHFLASVDTTTVPGESRLKIEATDAEAITIADASGTAATDLGVVHVKTGTDPIAAVNGNAADRTALETQYTSILGQIDQFVTDTGYQGINLLNGDTLTANFNADHSSSLTVTGTARDTSGLSMTTAGGHFFGDSTAVGVEQDKITAALTTLRTDAANYGNNLAVIQTRQDFTSNLINTLKDGASALTIADKNEEGANMLALQTSQQLGIQALSLASQANQSVLRLFQ